MSLVWLRRAVRKALSANLSACMMRIRGRLVLLFFCIKAAVCFNSWRAVRRCSMAARVACAASAALSGGAVQRLILFCVSAGAACHVSGAAHCWTMTAGLNFGEKPPRRWH